MPTFLPGPGPLAPSAHHPDEAAAASTDTWAFIAQSRSVAAYRGSYSAVSGAADEAFPQTGVWASSTMSRATAFYKSPSARTTPPFSITLDSYAPTAANPQAPFYAAPPAQTMSVFDPSANTFADWTPPPVQDRSVPNYSPPRSRVTPPSDFATILDTWAATAFGRATPYYTGSRAITIPVFDPATNTFADWTPAALLSRAVQPYSPPRARTLGSFGLSIITDAYAPLAQSRAVPFYRSPLSQILLQDVPLDTYTGVFASRSVPLYRSPASYLAKAYDQPVVTFGTDYAAPAQSRRTLNYRGSYSLIANAADESATVVFGTDWASVIQSRRVYYTRPPSLTLFPWFGPSGANPSFPVPIDPTVGNPRAGGGGDFVTFRDPFGHDPFRDPFQDSPLVIKRPRGER